MRVKNVDKSKITIVILSIVFALSMSVTITLAAFSANKSGDLTLTFADGLTMRLDPVESGSLRITTADESATTFSYTPVNNTTGSVYLDGIKATINKDAWIGVKIEFLENISGNLQAPSPGAYAINGTICRFDPGASYDWYSQMYKVGSSFTYSLTNSPNVFVCTSATICSASSSPIELFHNIVIWGKANNSYVNALAGRTFVFNITIKAQTDQAPTF